ncbi:unnamed protein product [Blepharisma stoltei]|uniref:Uncharacterized protein n=1 Tax=Blepharisma stoltei TaxID=1481888 RepID=A0AAU9K7X7_9CILI|nr:unnamed protein product [Blepharisma stoltei]
MDNEKFCNKISVPTQAYQMQSLDSSNKLSTITLPNPLGSSKYQALKNWYQENRKNQTISLMLNRITKNNKISSEFYSRPLLMLLEEICDSLMMEELEISLWAIYLDNIIWGKNASYFENGIWFASYAAKSSLSNDIEIYEKIIVEKIPNFHRFYDEWYSQHRSDLSVNSMNINQKYNKLSRIAKYYQFTVLNYNYYVDKILDSPKGAERMKKRIRGKNEDVLKKKIKLSKNKEKIRFEQGIVEKSIKNLKNEKKEAKELSRIEEGASSSVHTKDALRNEEQKKDTYIMGKIEMYCSGLIEANDLVLDDSLNEDWSILFD